MTLIDEL